jgi:hypothetical protein
MPSRPAAQTADRLTIKQRKTTGVSEILDRRIAAYALAAGAAGVSVAAMAQETPPSTIVYTPANISFYGGKSSTPPIPLDLNNDGITDITISAGGSGYSLGTANITYYQGAAGWYAAKGNGGVRRALGSGAAIGSKRKFLAGTLLLKGIQEFGRLRRHSYPHSRCLGPFKAPNSQAPLTAYLGVSFLISGETHYGWIRLTTYCDGGSVAGTITGYAYETVPNAPIPAGKTESGTAGAPTPAAGTLGMLGLGSGGLALWRK